MFVTAYGLVIQIELIDTCSLGGMMDGVGWDMSCGDLYFVLNHAFWMPQFTSKAGEKT